MPKKADRKIKKGTDTRDLPFEFHILRSARDRYGFSEDLVRIRMEDIKSNMSGIRTLADKVNRRRNALNRGEKPLYGSYLYAAGLIDAVYHYIIGKYTTDLPSGGKAPALFEELEDFLDKRFGGNKLEKLLESFAQNYPAVREYREGTKTEDYLWAESSGVPHAHIMLEEMIIIWLGNINPAFEPLIELVDDENLETETAYTAMMDGIDAFFRTKPRFGPENQYLIEMLRAPALNCPHSLLAQLEFMLTRWKGILGKFIETLLLKGLDLIKEEEKDRGHFSPGETYLLEFGGVADLDIERFSDDLDWMPKVVLMAKCTYVWLDQLSKLYGRNIDRLDHIPDSELDALASRGFTGLWLIGLWERSKASEKIKRMMGNPDAVSSAYSLQDYIIAHDLGGEEAYLDLKERAWKRGIRLASDMVPNHMGLDSSWVVEHPDWFVQLDNPPYPSYSFTCEDLCEDPRVTVQIEDGYWRKSDAAVVFRHYDHGSGRTRYIYHGNDGTQMPWNDTAQLNFLMGEVREAVIQTILHVARKFPIIRFDAAMTLAKRHYQRLWFPAPGSGGDIPSRAEHAISNEEFNRLFPVEFWREVVDRVRDEVPETLLLAEAFWMMEGYFVRTLGMHRVYNSAFMNMLKNEENWKYRQSIKNVLEFNPQILKRYVNFMNNPDEETAVAQFGKDGKYFGVSILMSTMPGLPMFGHGQVEGFSEKYGMEYRRAYRDEIPDGYLISRHEREVFPLLRKRYLFSGVENFLLYDFFTPEGHVDEDVFAYSNGVGNERGLVIYLNKFRSTKGWIKTSAAYTAGSGLMQKSLGEGLGLRREDGGFTIFRDQVTGLEYIRSSNDLHDQGLFTELGAFGYQVFLDFRQVRESAEKPLGRLSAWLGGRGVHSIEDAVIEMELQPLLHAFYEAVNPGSLRHLGEKTAETESTFRSKASHLLDSLKGFEPGAERGDEVISVLEDYYRVVTSLPELGGDDGKGWKGYLSTDPGGAASGDLQGYRLVLSWLFTRAIVEAKPKTPSERRSFDWIFERFLTHTIRRSFMDLGADEKSAGAETQMIRILIANEGKLTFAAAPSLHSQMEELLKSGEVQDFIDVNMHENILYFNKEKMETLIYWSFVMAIVELLRQESKKTSLEKKAGALYKSVQKAMKAAEKSGYKLKDFMDIL